MAEQPFTLGIIGGNGALGGAIARAVLERGTVAPDALWISSRSGRLSGLEDWPGLHATTDNQALASACDVIVLSVPPAQAGTLTIDAGDTLVLSVMAGVTTAHIKALTGAKRVVRAMSSPAAALGLAYSPWHATPDITDSDRKWVTALFAACGKADEVPEEGQLDTFTALTGPVPGFVAFYAQCMTDYAMARGIAPDVADRAVRQLFHASGVTLSTAAPSPAEQVQDMINYAGTTAAGLEAMRVSPISASIAEGLDAAVAKARAMGT